MIEVRNTVSLRASFYAPGYWPTPGRLTKPGQVLFDFVNLSWWFRRDPRGPDFIDDALYLLP